MNEHPDGQYVTLADYQALAAQVEALRDAGNEAYAELQQWALSESHKETNRAFAIWRKVRNATPAQCLREVRAEAGWAGVIHMHSTLAKCYSGYGSEHDSVEALLIADQYADRVKAGE